MRLGVEYHSLMLWQTEINCPPRTELSFLPLIFLVGLHMMGVYKMWVFLAEIGKIYFADIFEFGAV